MAKPKVLLTREDGVLVAKQYSFLAGNLIGVAVLRDDGSRELFAVNADPTYKEYYGIEVPDDAGYERKKRAIIESTGWTCSDEFPWLETDENGDAVAGTDTDERLTCWLNSEIADDHNLLETWGERIAGQYAPGFSLMWSLSKEEIDRLRMREKDLGGPASTLPCVASDASLEELNRVIEQNDLPFVVVDDEVVVDD